MTWLTGKPIRTRAILWPATDDADIRKVGTTERRDGRSISNSTLLHWISSTDDDKTVIYMADFGDAQKDEIVLRRVAELDYSAHRVALTHDGGFVCAIWLDRVVTLKRHFATGALLSERSVEAEAAYGDLVVHGSWVALCLNSGEGLPKDAEDEELPVIANLRFRIDYSDSACVSGFPTDFKLVADEIWLWNTADDSSERVKIPLIPEAPMIHSARFQFVGNHIVLAGSVEDDTRAAFVSFPFRQSAEPVAFVEQQLTNPECIERSVIVDPNNNGNIVVHCHESGSRITVFKSDLLVGTIPSDATSSDPPGFRESFHYPNDARTLPFSIANTIHLPSISADRILVKTGSSRSTQLYILDFDQGRLVDLVLKTQDQRERLRAELQLDGGRVQVVTRRYNWSDVDEMVDAEYPARYVAPARWNEYLLTAPSPLDTAHALEFDEPEEERRREPVPFGYVRSVLELGKEVNTMLLALVGDSVVAVPEAGQSGWIFDFA